MNLKQKQLLIGMLIGDGSTTNHPDYKIEHLSEQLEYLQWKLQLLESNGIKTTGLKKYNFFWV